MDLTLQSMAQMAQSIIDGDKDAALRLARDVLSGGGDPQTAVEEGFIPGIQKVGALWESGDYFLPELLASAEAMKAAMSVLRPALAAGRAAALSQGKVVLGTVEGDIHDIGKNLVAALLSANGFEVIDLGADVTIERFIVAAEESGADIIGLSALLTTTMLGQRRLIDELNRRGLRAKYAVLVGGAPVTQKWADEIGADGYGENALAAVRAAKTLAGRR
ncbi:MAG: dimethylamine corrinoid protein 3 [Candidatus Aminicenantes bacterium]|nr:dimethylamine corrinoid protein 3 [Candidatus Aminicenantes bacterium]